MYKQLEEYIRFAKIDVIIVTVSEFQGFSLDAYASRFYEYNPFLDDGVILAFGVQDELVVPYVAVIGKEASVKYNTVRKQLIINSIYDSLEKKTNYESASQFVVTLDGFYRAKLKGNYMIDGNGIVYKYIPWLEIIAIAVSFAFIGVIVFVYRLDNHNTLKYKDDLHQKIDPTTLKVEVESEKFLGNTFVDKK